MVSQAEYQAILDRMPIAIILADLEGVITYCNSICTRLIGYDEEELIGKKFHELTEIFLTKDLPNLITYFGRLLNAEDFKPIELQIRKTDGNLSWILVTASLLQFSGESFILALIQDITRKRAVEIELEKSREKFELLLENVNDLIIVVDPRLGIEYVNEAPAHRILGYSAHGLVGKRAITFVHPDDARRSLKSLMKTFDKGEGQEELRFRRANGEYMWLEVKGRPFLDHDREIKAIFISRDISERKRAEQKKTRLHAELQRQKNILEELDRANVDFIQLAFDLIGKDQSE